MQHFFSAISHRPDFLKIYVDWELPIGKFSHEPPMAALGHHIAPLPTRWLKPVIQLLEEGDKNKIQWTLTARSESRLLRFFNVNLAYDFCLQTLQDKGICGENIPDMRDQNQIICETWAFLCPHPQGFETPIYVKIGLLDNHLLLNLFSLHIDRSGKLAKSIADYEKKHP